MRPELPLHQARPLTWLLATVAGWALLAWLLTLLGMGTRLPQPRADEVLLDPLPVLAPAPTPRLGGPADYVETVRRPPFFAGRRPLAFVIGGGDAEMGEPTDPFEFVLTGVLISPSARVASLQRIDGTEGPRVQVGEVVEGHPGWRLLRLAPRMAVFAGPDGELNLELRKFTGVGGQAPTPMPARPPQPAAAPSDAASAAAAAAAAAQAAAMTPPPGGVPPATMTRPQPPQAADVNAQSENTPAQQAQLDAIRRRIEARRRELQQGAQPPQNP